MAGMSSIAFSGTEDNYLPSKRITVPKNTQMLYELVQGKTTSPKTLTERGKNYLFLRLPFHVIRTVLKGPTPLPISPSTSKSSTHKSTNLSTLMSLTFLPSAVISEVGGFSEVPALNKEIKSNFSAQYL